LCLPSQSTPISTAATTATVLGLVREGNTEPATGVLAAVTVRVILVATAALSLAGCLGGSEGPTAQPKLEKRRAADAFAASDSAPKGTCALTLPNGRTQPGANAAGMNHGNGKLWTTMWPHNVVIATPVYIEPDGAVGMKWPWWRGVRGRLTITGRRLDGKAPPLTAYVPDYGTTGFQPSGITFPTEGCWEVTGAVGDADLTFVTLILKASRYRPLPEDR
jgi:hypothetical protein